MQLVKAPFIGKASPFNFIVWIFTIFLACDALWLISTYFDYDSLGYSIILLLVRAVIVIIIIIINGSYFTTNRSIFTEIFLLKHCFIDDRKHNTELNDVDYKKLAQAYAIAAPHTDDVILSAVQTDTMLGFAMADFENVFTNNDHTGFIVINCNVLPHFENHLSIAAVMLHEFAHYQHRDARSRTIRLIAYIFICAVHPYLLPFILVLESCIRRYAEYAADHYAAKIF